VAAAPQPGWIPALVEELAASAELELAGWELLPETQAPAWSRLSRAQRGRLLERRVVGPMRQMRLDVLWHVQEPLAEVPEVEVRVAHPLQELARRHALCEGASEPAALSRIGATLGCSYSFPVPGWTEDAPVSLSIVLRHPDALRPPDEVRLGELVLSDIEALALEACAAAASADEPAARGRFAAWLEDERGLGRMAPCLCDWPELLEAPGEARCSLLGGRSAEAAGKLARGWLAASGRPRAAALALAELAEHAVRGGDAPAAEALYAAALLAAPDLVTAALGLQRMGSARGTGPLAALRRSGPVLLPAARWRGRWGPALYSDGPAELRWLAVEGPARIEVAVRGTPAAGEWPRLRASLDGQLLGEHVADHEDERPWRLEGRLRGGTNVLRVEYLNDLALPEADRNAFLGEVRVEHLAPGLP
jgi:hypothetical protein